MKKTLFSILAIAMVVAPAMFMTGCLFGGDSPTLLHGQEIRTLRLDSQEIQVTFFNTAEESYLVSRETFALGGGWEFAMRAGSHVITQIVVPSGQSVTFTIRGYNHVNRVNYAGVRIF